MVILKRNKIVDSESETEIKDSIKELPKVTAKVPLKTTNTRYDF